MQNLDIEEEEDECAAMMAIDLLGRKWIPLILCELLLNEELFFSDLLNNIVGQKVKDKQGEPMQEKISARVLSESLSRLEEQGIVNRVVVSDTMPMRVNYSLTEKGNDLKVIFATLKGWGIKYGGIKQKKCKSFSCIHNSVPMIDIDKAKELFETRKEKEKFPLRGEER